jgi:hypothetical protein
MSRKLHREISHRWFRIGAYDEQKVKNRTPLGSLRFWLSSCPASAPVRHMWTASWQALFFALNGLVGCGHMSGLVARRICPLALMKSDD